MTDHAHVLKGPHFLLTSAGELHGEDSEENREFVRRIQACVAACEGISTEELESGIIQDMRRVIATVAPILESNIDDRRRELGIPTGDQKTA